MNGQSTSGAFAQQVVSRIAPAYAAALSNSRRRFAAEMIDAATNSGKLSGSVATVLSIVGHSNRQTRARRHQKFSSISAIEALPRF